MAKRKLTTVFDAENKGLRTAVTQGVTEMQKLKRAASKESRAIGREWGRMAQSMGSAFQKISAAGTLAFGVATKAAMDFGKEMANFNSIAQQSEQVFRQTTQTILRANADMETAQGPKTLAAGLYQIQSAGYEAADAMTILKDAALGADAGAAGAAVVADGLTTELSALGLTAAQSSKTLDMMLSTVQRGKVTMEQYSANIGTVANKAKMAGVTQTELHGAIALLTKRTGQANQSFTAFRALTEKLAAPPKEAREKYAELGLSFGAAAVEANGLIGQLRLMQQATGGDAVKFGELLGGSSEAKGAADVLLGGDGGASALDEIAAAANSAGVAKAAFAKQAASAKFQFDRLMSTVSAAAIIFANSIAPALEMVTSGLQTLVSGFVQLDPKIQSAISLAAAFATALTGVAGVALTVAPSLVAASGAIKAYAASQIGATAAAARYMTTTGALSTVVTGSIAAMGRAALAFVTGPIGIAIAAATAFYLAWSRNLFGFRDAAENAFGSMWRAAVDVFQPVIEMGREMAVELIGAVSEIGGEIAAFVSENEDLFRGVLVTTLEVVKVAFIGILEATRTWVRFSLPAIRSLAALMSGDYTAALEYAKTAQQNLFADAQRGWRKVSTAVFESQDRVWEAVEGTSSKVIVRQGEVASSVQKSYDTLAESINVGVFKASGVAIDRLGLLESAAVGVANSIQTAFARAGAAVTGVAGAVGLGAGFNPALMPPGGGGHDHDHKKKKSGGFDRSEAIAFIKANAMAGSNLGAIGSLQDKTIKAMREGIERGIQNGIQILIHSTFRKGKGHHGSGEAFDASAFGAGINLSNDAATLAQLFSGTDVKAVIDENRAGVLAKTGGSGAHSHLTTGFQQQFQGTDGKDAVIYTDGSILSDIAEKAQQRETAIEEAIHKIEESTLTQMDSLIGMFESQHEKFGNLEKLATEFRVNQLQGAATITEGLPGMFDKMEEEAAAQEAADERKYQSAVRLWEQKLALNLVEREDYILWLQEQAEMDDLFIGQKLERRLKYNEEVRQMEQTTGQFSQQIQQSVGNGLQNALTSAITGQQTFAQAAQSMWRNLFNQIISYIVKAIIKATILKAIMSSLTGGLGLLGMGAVAKVGAAAKTGVSTATGIAEQFANFGGTFHSGGIVGRGSNSMGTREVLAKLEKDEGVIDRDTMRKGLGGRGRQIVQHFNNLTINDKMDAGDFGNMVGFQIGMRLQGA